MKTSLTAPATKPTSTSADKPKGLSFLKTSPFFIRLLHWEYWPFYLVYIPIYVLWLYYALRCRALFFYSAANPAIELGGMMGERKHAILQQVNEAYKPRTLLFHAETPMPQVEAQIEAAGLSYPVMAKPNIGDRALAVCKINNSDELKAYTQKNQVDFLIQAFVDLPQEYSVLYYRYPGATTGRVNSVCIKGFLDVTGDGHSTVEQLMWHNPRAVLQIGRFRREKPELLKRVPDKDEVLRIENVGNHHKGIKFIDGNFLIDDQLVATFDTITMNFKGINFCRFDLRCTSDKDLKAGRNIKIVEVNGVGAEPSHIYDPKHSIWDAWAALFRQWRIIYRISVANHKNGVSYTPFSEAVKSIKRYIRIHQRTKGA